MDELIYRWEEWAEYLLKHYGNVDGSVSIPAHVIDEWGQGAQEEFDRKFAEVAEE